MISALDGISMLFGYAIFVAIFAIGIAFWLSTSHEPKPLRVRAMVAGGASSAILTMIPVVVVATEEFGTELLIIAVVLIALGGFLAAVVGFPVAYFCSKRFDAKRAERAKAE